VPAHLDAALPATTLARRLDDATLADLETALILNFEL